MDHHARTQELIAKYLERLLSAEELAELQQSIVDDPCAADAFADATRVDATLAELFRQPTEISDPRELLRDPPLVASGETNAAAAQAVEEPKHAPADISPLTPHHSLFNVQRLRMIAAIAAALLLVIGGLWFGRGDSVAWATVVEAGPGVSIVEDGQSRPARRGDRLRRDESISVTEDATARVQVAGLGSAALGPSTRLLPSREERVVDLRNGFAEIAALRQAVGQPWRIRTSQAEASVLGTEFNIASANGRTALRVAEGRVRLTNLLSGRTEEVSGGERAMVDRESPPIVAPSRPGSVLVITSRQPDADERWISDRFNQRVTEKLLSARLWQMSYRVEVRHFDEVQAADLANRALVIVSLFHYGVGEPALERIGLARADVPVICLEPAGYPSLGMTVANKGDGFGYLEVHSPVEFVAPQHPLAAGVDGSREGLLRRHTGWGRPAGDAMVIAHLPEQPEHAVVFAYDAGQRMAEFPAPARRVGLFFDPTGIIHPSDEAWSLLEAAANWCVAVGDRHGG